MNFRNRGNRLRFFFPEFVPFDSNTKLLVEFIFIPCQNQPWFSLWLKSTTSLNSLTINFFSICHYDYHDYGYEDFFFLLLFISKNICLIQRMSKTWGVEETFYMGKPCCSFKKCAHREGHTPLSQFLFTMAPCHQPWKNFPIPSILHPHILYLSLQYQIFLSHFQWWWVCSTCFISLIQQSRWKPEY